MTVAILVLDVQPVIMGNIPNSEETLKTITKVIDNAKKHGAIGAFVRVAFEHSEWKAIDEKTKNLYAMKERFNSHDQTPPVLHLDSDEAALHPLIKQRVEKSDIYVRKVRFGPFSNTSLLKDLQSKNVDTLLIVGFKTSGAVLSAVRFAADHNIRIFVIKDGVLDQDLEVHNILIEKIFAEQANVIASNEIEKVVFNTA